MLKEQEAAHKLLPVQRGGTSSRQHSVTSVRFHGNPGSFCSQNHPFRDREIGRMRKSRNQMEADPASVTANQMRLRPHSQRV